MPLAKKRKVRALRTAQRFPTDIPAILRRGHEVHHVKIADLSAGGAKIRCQSSVPIGAGVTLETRARTIDALVMWLDEQSCGLRFMNDVEPLAIVRENLPALRRVLGDQEPLRSDAYIYTLPEHQRV